MTQPKAISRKWSLTTWVLFGMVFYLIHGCATLDQLIQKPTVSFDSLSMENASLLESTLNFDFNIDNPNPIGLRAGRVSYDLKINGRPFTRGQLNRGVSVPAGSVGGIRIPVTVAYLDFLESVSAMVRNRMADYDLSGTVAVGPIDVPFKTKGQFNLPRMPKISLGAVKIEKLSLGGARLNCQLRMDNPNAFDLLFKQLNYTLTLGGTQIAKTKAAPLSPLGGEKASMINLALDISFADIGRAAYQMLLGKNSTYKIDGHMLMDSPGSEERLVPFNASGNVPFIR